MLFTFESFGSRLYGIGSDHLCHRFSFGRSKIRIWFSSYPRHASSQPPPSRRQNAGWYETRPGLRSGIFFVDTKLIGLQGVGDKHMHVCVANSNVGVRVRGHLNFLKASAAARSRSTRSDIHDCVLTSPSAF